MAKITACFIVALLATLGAAAPARADIPEECIIRPSQDLRSWVEERQADVEMLLADLLGQRRPASDEAGEDEGPVPDLNGCTTDISDPQDPEVLCKRYETVHNDNAYIHGQKCVYKDGQPGYSCEYVNVRGEDGSWTTTSTPPNCDAG